MDPTALALQQLLALANGLLKLDPEARERLRPLAGHVLAVELDGIDLPLRVAFSEEGIAVADPDAAADVTVRARPAALLTLALSGGQKGAGAVEFRGDVAVVHGIRQLVSSLEIDWEEQLSRFTGDVVAHQLGRMARAGLAWLSQARTTFEQNAAEYLTEESRALPAEAEVSAFLAEVDRLRQDADRLQARIALLEKRGKGR